MRIIGGKYKGKKLKTFEGQEVRPTSDRARESLFNILSSKVINCKFLDLCCGTGAVGLEALSRGAREVYFNDLSKKSLEIAKCNILSVKEDVKKITCLDAKSFIKSNTQTFDIIFFDPPYEFKDVEEILKLVVENDLLTENGIFIYEHNADKPSKQVEFLNLYDTRKYGIAKFDFYSKI